jgi:hypothetical protein
MQQDQMNGTLNLLQTQSCGCHAGGAKKRRRLFAEERPGPEAIDPRPAMTASANGTAAALSKNGAKASAIKGHTGGRPATAPGLSCPSCSACGPAPRGLHSEHRLQREAPGKEPRAGASREGCGELRRCCYCREAVYCSQECVLAHADMHREMHAMRFVFFARRQLHYDNIVDFAPLPVY